MQTKDDKVRNKTANKEEWQRKKESERERSIDVDSQKKLWLLRMREKHTFFLARLVLTIVMLMSRKLVQTSPRNW